MRIHAYKNLHRDAWSLRDPGTRRVFGHAAHVELVDVDFRVQEGGRQAVLRDGVRRVHAFVSGRMVVRAARRRPRRGVWQRFSYSPFRAAHFTLCPPADPLPIFYAERVRLDRDGAWCQGPRHAP